MPPNAECHDMPRIARTTCCSSADKWGTLKHGRISDREIDVPAKRTIQSSARIPIVVRLSWNSGGCHESVVSGIPEVNAASPLASQLAVKRDSRLVCIRAQKDSAPPSQPMKVVEVHTPVRKPVVESDTGRSAKGVMFG